MIFPDSEPQSRAVSGLQQALAILTKQLYIPDSWEDARQQPKWENVSSESTRNNACFESE